MRKIGKARHVVGGFGHGLADSQYSPGGRATVTSWPGTAHIDLTAFFARQGEADSVRASGTPAQADPLQAHRRNDVAKTVFLSDGTQLVFATAAPIAVPAGGTT
jgi:acyl-coenzyme A thioesterase PaaI-like protein